MAADRRESTKEIARRLRRQAYERAKERREQDPRYAAMKESAKLRRRAGYAQARERRKALAAERKAIDAEKQAEKLAEERAAKDRELLKLVKRGR